MVGVFLEAATRHCEIKINWQEMFAIPIPVSARRAESTGKGEYVESPLRSAGICLLPLEGLPVTHFPSSFVPESVVLRTCDYPLQREGRNTFKGCIIRNLSSLRRHLRH